MTAVAVRTVPGVGHIWDRTAPTLTQALRCAAHNQQGCTQ